jgi:hypothetical protein
VVKGRVPVPGTCASKSPGTSTAKRQNAKSLKSRWITKSMELAVYAAGSAAKMNCSTAGGNAEIDPQRRTTGINLPPPGKSSTLRANALAHSAAGRDHIRLLFRSDCASG